MDWFVLSQLNPVLSSEASQARVGVIFIERASIDVAIIYCVGAVRSSWIQLNLFAVKCIEQPPYGQSVMVCESKLHANPILLLPEHVVVGFFLRHVEKAEWRFDLT